MLTEKKFTCLPTQVGRQSPHAQEHTQHTASGTSLALLPPQMPGLNPQGLASRQLPHSPAAADALTTTPVARQAIAMFKRCQQQVSPGRRGLRQRTGGGSANQGAAT